jgi:hypothetical protein
MQVKPEFEALASKALFASLVVAPPDGQDFTLLFLDAEPNKTECRELSAKGWSPVVLFAWTEKGLEFEHDAEFKPRHLRSFMYATAAAFMAAARQHQAADRAKVN